MGEKTRKEELLELKAEAEEKLENASVQWKSRREKELEEIVAELAELEAEENEDEKVVDEDPVEETEEVEENEPVEDLPEEAPELPEENVKTELHLNSEEGVVDEEVNKEYQEKVLNPVPEDEEPKPAPVPEKVQINQMTTDRPAPKPAPKENRKGKKEYVCVMQTPKGKEVPFNFKKGVTKMAKFGRVLWLTEEEYQCHKEYFSEVIRKK